MINFFLFVFRVGIWVSQLFFLTEVGGGGVGVILLFKLGFYIECSSTIKTDVK